jgi:hypothetical protein
MRSVLLQVANRLETSSPHWRLDETTAAERVTLRCQLHAEGVHCKPDASLQGQFSSIQSDVPLILRQYSSSPIGLVARRSIAKLLHRLRSACFDAPLGPLREHPCGTQSKQHQEGQLYGHACRAAA